jgi:hypothetical protein
VRIDFNKVGTSLRQEPHATYALDARARSTMVVYITFAVWSMRELTR